MAQEEATGLTPEQITAAEETAKNGRVADLDAAAAKLAKAGDTDQQAKDQAAIDAENAAKEAAEKAAEEAAKKDPDKNDDGSWKENWVQTGNVHADAAIEMMNEAGMSPVEGNAIFAKAIESGDLKDVDWDVLEARLGKTKALLVRTGVENYYNQEYAEQKAVTEYAHEQVGGEKGWQKIQAWAKSQENDPAFAKTLNEWRNALAVGGFAARAAVDAAKRAYEAAPGNSTLNKGGKPLERGQAPNTAQVEGEPLSRSAYYEAMERAGGDRAPEHVKRDLQARRAKGREMGI